MVEIDYYDNLFGFAKSKLPTREDAEDCVQSTYESYYTHNYNKEKVVACLFWILKKMIYRFYYPSGHRVKRIISVDFNMELKTEQEELYDKKVILDQMEKRASNRHKWGHKANKGRLQMMYLRAEVKPRIIIEKFQSIILDKNGAYRNFKNETLRNNSLSGKAKLRQKRGD